MDPRETGTAIRSEPLVGDAIRPVLDDLARLRVRVFREYPYPYDGSPEYEAGYLRTYLDCPESVVVVARDGEQVVGASTGLPMEYETEDVRRPFRARGYGVGRVFYLGESVLLPDYRGRGLGVRFFEEREAHARRLGRFDLAAFCAVQRPPDHTRRPADHVPLDEFWKRRGYQRHPELATTFSWKDLDEAEESPKPMVFWLKDLRAGRGPPRSCWPPLNTG
jgi:GNAT superfamily N-acetyltransferase